MLTVDYRKLGAKPGESLLDIGCGAGRHTFEAVRLGLHAISFDLDGAVLKDVAAMTTAMKLEEDSPGTAACVSGTALSLPFASATFDRAIASEVLEHIVEDERAISEIARVLRPGGSVAVTVPRWWTERVCWALSGDYHDVAGGHVRIYRVRELIRKFSRSGFALSNLHYAHALHSPYWWIKCAFGLRNDGARLPRLYHRLLVWDIVKKPFITRFAEKVLDPVLGKSLVLYFDKPPAELEESSRDTMSVT